ncbi:MAG: diguanylate cyclase [Armatimonadetes bacterium]|nr:diguanylate cyclase [Armatimonadota bacterium]
MRGARIERSRAKLALDVLRYVGEVARYRWMKIPIGKRLSFYLFLGGLVILLGYAFVARQLAVANGRALHKEAVASALSAWLMVEDERLRSLELVSGGNLAATNRRLLAESRLAMQKMAGWKTSGYFAHNGLLYRGAVSISEEGRKILLAEPVDFGDGSRIGGKISFVPAPNAPISAAQLVRDGLGNPIGAWKVDLPHSALAKVSPAVEQAGWLLFGFGLIMILGATFGLVVTLRRLMRPFVEASARLSVGDWESRVIYAANDEFGQLSLAFNRMAESLNRAFEDSQRQQSEIELNKRNLEQLNDRLTQANGELQRANQQLLDANARLEEAATTDGLTGLSNHRTFQDALLHLCQMARRYEQWIALVVLDIDHFKDYNDTFGHPAGDELLKLVAQTLRITGRDADIVARHGGEEFALILPNTDLKAAVQAAERLREAIGLLDCIGGRVTASFGVSAAYGPDVMAGNLLLCADKAMYEAKRSGRNRVCVSDQSPGARAS